MRDWNMQALENFDRIAAREMKDLIDHVDNEKYLQAASLILEAQERGNRIHITGIGKPGHVSAYGASLLSSTGTPTYFLHGTEAVHGSCGQLVAGDVLIAISNSGETAELKATINAVKNNGCHVIAVTGNEDSWLASQAEVHLFAGGGRPSGPGAQGFYPGREFRDSETESHFAGIPEAGSGAVREVASRRQSGGFAG